MGDLSFLLKPNNLDSMGSRRFLLWLLVVWTAPGTGCLCRAAGWKFCIVRGPVEDPQSCGGSNNTRHSAKRWGFSRVIFQGGEQNVQNISFIYPEKNSISNDSRFLAFFSEINHRGTLMEENTDVYNYTYIFHCFWQCLIQMNEDSLECSFPSL